MIQIKNLSKKFKTDFWAKPFTALDNLNFNVPTGKIVGFLGANGAGKTTSLKIIMGFIKPTSGVVEYAPVLGNSFEEIRQKIGFVPERPYFYPHLTGREFLSYMGSLNNLSRTYTNEQIKKWSARLKIDFALERKIHSYSKGMLQRLGFISALIHNPELIVLDEPVSGMDPVGRKEIKDAIREVNREGKTVFFSSHIVPDVEEICDEVIFIDKGKLVYQGEIDQIIYDNIKAIYHVKLRKLSDGSKENYQVDSKDKNSFIKNKLDAGYEILSLQQEKMSLEEIFYNVRNESRISE